MGTPCVIQFADACQDLRLFSHLDGYPADILPLIQEVELRMKSSLLRTEKHLGKDAYSVASSFSHHDNQIAKEAKAEAEVSGENWHKHISSISQFVFFDRQVDFDVDYYYTVDVAQGLWRIECFEVIKDTAQAIKEDRPPRVLELKPVRAEIPPATLSRLALCDICRELYPPEMTEQDHEQPKSKGGKGKSFNLRTLCTNCHRMISNRLNSGRDKRDFSNGQQPLF